MVSDLPKHPYQICGCCPIRTQDLEMDIHFYIGRSLEETRPGSKIPVWEILSPHKLRDIPCVVIPKEVRKKEEKKYLLHPLV